MSRKTVLHKDENFQSFAFHQMSTMRLVFFALIYFVHRCSSNDDSSFQVLPQPVWINNLDEKYITNDKHYIGQVLYRSDQVELGCDCQSELDDVQHFIYWTMNDRLFHRFNNSHSFQLFVDRHTVQVPISYVTCYCVFVQGNSTRIKKDYQYLLYIDLESEPSLKPIHYSIETHALKERVHTFIQRHFLMIPILYVLAIFLTSFVIIWGCIRPPTDVALSRNE